MNVASAVVETAVQTKVAPIRSGPRPGFAFHMSGVIFASRIHVLTKSRGEYQRAPRKKPRTVTARMARGLRLRRAWDMGADFQVGRGRRRGRAGNDSGPPREKKRIRRFPDDTL